MAGWKSEKERNPLKTQGSLKLPLPCVAKGNSGLGWARLGRGLQRMVPGEFHFLAPHTIMGTTLHGAFAEVERGPHFVSRFYKYEPFLRTSFQIE